MPLLLIPLLAGGGGFALGAASTGLVSKLIKLGLVVAVVGGGYYVYKGAK